MNDTLLGIHIGKDAITWGDWNEKCMIFPNGGFFKRENEKFVLPHAIGCQSPAFNSAYDLILKGSV